MVIKKISQSFLKGYNEYKGKNLCGLQFKAQHFDNIGFVPTLPMDLGNYFEFMATGSLPRDGHIPIATKSYVGTKKECLSAPYKRATESALLFQKIKKGIGLNIHDVGVKLETQNKNGILDIWGDINGRPCIVDLKYSGLIDDKWSETGWDAESLHYKEKLLVQAVQYKMLVAENFNLEYKDFDFFFMVFSSSEVMNVKFFKINIDEDNFDIHEKHIQSIFTQVNKMNIEKDFIPYPSLKACSKCVLKETCEYKTELPPIQEIYY